MSIEKFSLGCSQAGSLGNPTALQPFEAICDHADFVRKCVQSSLKRIGRSILPSFILHNPDKHILIPLRADNLVGSNIIGDSRDKNFSIPQDTFIT